MGSATGNTEKRNQQRQDRTDLEDEKSLDNINDCLYDV